MTKWKGTNPATGRARIYTYDGPEMSFIDVLNNPDSKKIVERIEWGSSDKELTFYDKVELFETTGIIYQN